MPVKQGLKQVSAKSWRPEDTRPIAFLKTPVSTLARRFNLRFQADSDDLDFVRFAVVRLPAGQKLAFVEHKNTPRKGVEVVAEADADLGSTLASFLLATGIRSESLLWTTPLKAGRPTPKAQSKPPTRKRIAGR